MSNDHEKDEQDEKRKLGLDPTNTANICSGCAMPVQQCICVRSGGVSSSNETEDTPAASTEEAPSQRPSDRPSLKLFSKKTPTLDTPNENLSKIELILKHAKDKGLDPQKLLRNAGIDPEQKANIQELQRLAQSGDKMAKKLYTSAAENAHSPSKLAAKLLEAVRNPFHTKKVKK